MPPSRPLDPFLLVVTPPSSTSHAVPVHVTNRIRWTWWFVTSKIKLKKKQLASILLFLSSLALGEGSCHVTRILR